MGGYACTNGKSGEHIHLICNYGTIYGLISIGYSSDATKCKNDVSDQNDIRIQI